MYVFFYTVDGWSIVKLTGSMFFFDILLRHFRKMVDREVDGPVWVVLSRSLGLCWQFLAARGAYVGDLGLLLEPRGRSWRLCWRSGAALGAYVGGIGPLLGRLLAVLGRLGPKNAKNIATLKICLFHKRESDL